MKDEDKNTYRVVIIEDAKNTSPFTKAAKQITP